MSFIFKFLSNFFNLIIISKWYYFMILVTAAQTSMFVFFTNIWPTALRMAGSLINVYTIKFTLIVRRE